MIPPKYKFYSGKALNLTMTIGAYINSSTGAFGYNSANHVTSNKVSVSTKAIYVNYSPADDKLSSTVYAESLNLHMYKDNGTTYLGRIAIDKAKLCTLNEGTTSIVLEFIGYNESIQQAHKSLAKTGFSEIYEANEVIPHYKELSKKYTKESEQEFFRISLEGKITLHGDGYEIIKNANLNNTFIFLVEKLNAQSSTWYEYFKGQFNKTDCKFDHEKKKCELKLTALDRYNKLLEGYDNTYDLIKLTPEITKIDMYKRALIQVYIRGANSISNFFGGTYWEDDVNEAIDSFEDLTEKYHFAYIKAGNEFYIRNAGIAAVNGVYAGTNGVWNQWNGYTCYVDTEDLDPALGCFIYIKRNSDNTILYKSDSRSWFSGIHSNNIFIAGEAIIMVNVNDDTDKFNIQSPFLYHIYQRLLCDIDTVTDSEGTKATYNIPVDDFVTDNRNYRKCIGLTGGYFFCTSRTVTEPTKYGLNDYGEYFTNQFIPFTAGLGRPLPICKSTWANASLWYVYQDLTYELWEQQLRKKYTLNDSFSICAVIKALLKKIDPTIRHEATAEYSNFLYGTTNPLGANRFYVFITQKTNILKSQYDQTAQKAEVTFEDIAKMLRDCFRCYLYIENNKLKIEHISYFMNGGSYTSNANVQLDFTKLNDMFNKKLTAYFQSEVEYDKSELNSRYEFNWMDDATELFGQVTIDVNANYVQKDKKEEVNVSKFSSDVDFMLFNPSNFSSDGFALLCAVKNGSKYELPMITSSMTDDSGDTYDFISQNWYASWAYLASSFYMYDMPAYNIDMNVNRNVYVQRIKKCMKHTIEFPIAEDLDELKLVKTSFGNGKIDEYTINLDTRMAKVNLMYEPQ